jgi:MoaA/NifB/PqqE/SkfB family radical SAM enzyme
MSKLRQWQRGLEYAWWSSVTPLVNHEVVPVPSPFHLTFSVTHRCNSRCRMCYIWQKESGKDLNIEEISRIFAQNDFSSLTALTLTGGEPTLRNDLVDLLVTVTRACPRIHQVTLATNGFNPRRTIEQVKGCLGVLQANPSIERFFVQVSLDGVGELHDLIRGVPGFYDRVMETLVFLKKMAQTEERLSLKLSSTVQPANVDSVSELQGLAEHLDIPIRFGALVFSSRYYGNIADEALRFKPEQAKRTSAIFSQMADANPGANVKFYYRDAARMALGAQRTKVCMQGYYGFVLEHDGNVYPCVNCEDRAFGNLCTHSFREVWRGTHAQALRREMRAHCCPGCTSICYTLPGDIVQVADVAWQRLMRRVQTRLTRFGSSTDSRAPDQQSTRA